MSNDPDKTPDPETPMDLVLRRLGELQEDVREAKGHAFGTYNLQLDLNQRFNSLEVRVSTLERSRVWVPLVVAGVAFLVALVTFVRSVGAVP